MEWMMLFLLLFTQIALLVIIGALLMLLKVFAQTLTGERQTAEKKLERWLALIEMLVNQLDQVVRWNRANSLENLNKSASQLPNIEEQEIEKKKPAPSTVEYVNPIRGKNPPSTKERIKADSIALGKETTRPPNESKLDSFTGESSAVKELGAEEEEIEFITKKGQRVVSNTDEIEADGEDLVEDNLHKLSPHQPPTKEEKWAIASRETITDKAVITGMLREAAPTAAIKISDKKLKEFLPDVSLQENLEKIKTKERKEKEEEKKIIKEEERRIEESLRDSQADENSQ